MILHETTRMQVHRYVCACGENSRQHTTEGLTTFDHVWRYRPEQCQYAIVTIPSADPTEFWILNLFEIYFGLDPASDVPVPVLDLSGMRRMPTLDAALAAAVLDYA